MSSLPEQLLGACAEGNLVRVRELIALIRQSAPHDLPFEAMARKAAENGHANVLELCIDEGADLSDLRLDDATDSDDVLKLLITKGLLDINEDWELAGDLLINSVWELKYDFTKWLLDHGADPNSGHLLNDSTTAITAVAAQGRTDLADLLFQHHARLSGSGALAAAAEKKQLPMVRWLLDQGAEIDEIGVHDYGDRRNKQLEGTALHKAAANGHLDMAKLLVERGASLSIKDPFDRTALARALEANQEEVAEYLRSSEAT